MFTKQYMVLKYKFYTHFLLMGQGSESNKFGRYTEYSWWLSYTQDSVVDTLHTNVYSSLQHNRADTSGHIWNLKQNFEKYFANFWIVNFHQWMFLIKNVGKSTSALGWHCIFEA